MLISAYFSCCFDFRQSSRRFLLQESDLHVTLLDKASALYRLMCIRTSDSLNEGLPIKMTREKFQRKCYFFYEKDSRFNPRLIHKSRFLIGQVPIEKYGLKTLFLLSTYRK